MQYCAIASARFYGKESPRPLADAIIQRNLHDDQTSEWVRIGSGSRFHLTVFMPQCEHLSGLACPVSSAAIGQPAAWLKITDASSWQAGGVAVKRRAKK